MSDITSFLDPAWEASRNVLGPLQHPRLGTINKEDGDVVVDGDRRVVR